MIFRKYIVFPFTASFILVRMTQRDRIFKKNILSESFIPNPLSLASCDNST